MIGHILLKDWKLLWPLVVLVTLIQIALEWVTTSWGLFGGELAIRELFRPLTLAWFIGIAALCVAVVQQDPVPGIDQDWLIRPLHRTHLLLAKLLFVALTISVPMLIVNLVDALYSGFPAGFALGSLIFKELYVYVCFILPVLALAAIAGSMSELVLLGAALVVVFAASLGLGALLLGNERCPTCDTSIEWVQHVLQHIGVLAGAVAILIVQYYHRRTGIARALALLGVIAFVFAQLPWSTAFAVQRWFAPAPGSAAAVALAFDAQAERAPSSVTDGGAGGIAQATHALVHGDVDQAVGYLKGRTRTRNLRTAIDLPVRIAGVAPDEMLLFDRSEVRLTGTDGEPLFHGLNTDQLVPLNMAFSGAAGSPAVSHQPVYFPTPLYRALAARELRLELHYSLTLMKVSARQEVAAQNGFIRIADGGSCGTRVDRDALSILLRCQQIGPGPFCVSATLYGPEGQHNPQVSNCDPEYRPHLPGFTQPILMSGIYVPLRDPLDLARYPVPVSDLARSYLKVSFYAVREHTTRTLVIPRIRLDEWRGSQ
jgi:hypothetical protein